MARLTVHLLEDECPGQVGRLTDNLRVHQVSQSDAAGRDRGGDGDVVEHRPHAQFGATAIQPEGNDQTQCATVRRQSGITRELPTAVSHLMHRNEHLQEMGARRQEIVGLIKQTMTQARSQQDAEETVYKQRVKQLVLDFLVLIQPTHHKIRTGNSYQPAHTIPPQRNRSQMAYHLRRVPSDVVEQLCHMIHELGNDYLIREKLTILPRQGV